jgi:hypothetical protein
MGSRMVRMREEDIERINDLSGLAPAMPFSAKVHAVLQRLQRGSDLEAYRAVLREELERLAGA